MTLNFKNCLIKIKESILNNMIEPINYDLDYEHMKEECDIISEIKDVCNQMVKTEHWFQSESDNDLIDACIHQRKVLHARYKYLLNKAKEYNIKISPYLVN